MESLNEKEYDYIILGTDIVESVLAGALTQTGSKVIHLDKNNFYGGLSNSFNLSEFINFLLKQHQDSGLFNNVSIQWPNFKTIVDNVSSNPTTPHETNEIIENLITKFTEATNDNEDSSIELIKDTFFDLYPKLKNNNDYSIMINETILELWNCIKSLGPGLNSSFALYELILNGFQWINQLVTQSRNYTIELNNKTILCDNSTTQLLIDSKTHRYLEFRLFNQSCLFIENQIEKVPISKSDVFTDSRLSLIDKRKMMKFITFALKTIQEPELLEDIKDKQLESYLIEEYKLSNNIVWTIIHLIAGWELPPNQLNVEQGIQLCNRFIASLNKYGNHAYLWGLYGTASEVCQAFCRIAAVYGAVYILDHTVDRIELDIENSAHPWNVDTDIEGQLKGRKLITSIDYVPENLSSYVKPRQYVYKSIFIIDETDCIHPVFSPQSSENNDETSSNPSNGPQSLILCSVPPKTKMNPYESPIFILRASSDTQACPQSQAVIYIWMTVDAQNQLDDLANENFTKLFNEFLNTYSQTPSTFVNIHYEQTIRKFDIPVENHPPHLMVIDDIGTELILDTTISTIPNLFKELRIPELKTEEDWEFFPKRYDSLDYQE